MGYSDLEGYDGTRLPTTIKDDSLDPSLFAQVVQ